MSKYDTTLCMFLRISNRELLRGIKHYNFDTVLEDRTELTHTYSYGHIPTYYLSIATMHTHINGTLNAHRVKT